MFLSLWLFVEFVFLEKKQVRLSDLKVTAFIIIVVSSAAVQTAGPNLKYSGTYICPTGSSSLKREERRRKENRVNQETMKMREQSHSLTTQPRALMLAEKSHARALC